MGLSKKEKTEQKVNELLTKITESTEYEVVDIEYLQERGQWFLRAFVDSPSGFGLDDCQWVSERLSEALEETDCIESAYNLEVSSPGLDRQLKKEKDFLRYAGRMVEMHLFAPVNGNKIFTGELKGLFDDNIIILVEGNELSFARQKVSLVKLYVEF